MGTWQAWIGRFLWLVLRKSSQSDRSNMSDRLNNETGILSRSGCERVRVPWTSRVGAQGGRNLGGFERLIKIQHRRRRDWWANANGQFIVGWALIFDHL